jgi:hypothetical protein
MRGLLEIVVDETGKVESAVLATPVWPAYNSTLLAAASRWRYRPAVKAGQPVKYRRLLEVVLNPPKKLPQPTEQP